MKSSHRIGDSMVKDPITIAPTVQLGDAQEIMRAWGVRHLPIVDGDKIVGVISDRNIYRALSIKQDYKMIVQEVMNKSPYVVTADVSLKEIAKEMAKHKYGCALVKSISGKVRGIFTTVDALYILAQLLDDPDDRFRLMNIEDYLSHHQKMAV